MTTKHTEVKPRYVKVTLDESLKEKVRKEIKKGTNKARKSIEAIQERESQRFSKEAQKSKGLQAQVVRLQEDLCLSKDLVRILRLDIREFKEDIEKLKEENERAISQQAKPKKK